ncbi:MAG: class I SAM-dependent methyltransferase [Pseudomonadota bacterium]
MHAIDQRLACPRCDTPLKTTSDGIQCKGCRTDFPALNGVPFLFADPGVALDEWRQRYHSRLRDVEVRAATLAAAIDAVEIDATKARLTHERQALAEHLDELRAVLAPLDMTSLAADHNTYLALRTRLPDDQGLVTYYANLHRDWCWGAEENQRSVDLVSAAIGDSDPGALLVLGAGGGRLAYDLHQRFNHSLTVAVDFNPLLMIAASRICSGEPLLLHEFPIAPLRSSDVAVSRELSAPEAAREGLHFVLANVLRSPFLPGSFDTLLTPWLVDVVDEPLAIQARRWNRLLAPGGRWIWFGSHAFRSGSVAEHLSIEESVAIIEASGFSDINVEEADIPYMVSPANRHARQERVVVISMTKTAEVEPPSRHVALPDWLVQTHLSVPTSASFQNQGMTSRIQAFFFSMIDGQRSLDDMGLLMEQERLMSKEEGIASLRNFLIRALAESEGYDAL